MTANDLYLMLREKYPSDAYVMLPEVRGGTGSLGKRFADVLVQGLWPSRGLELEGFEIKISRNDWLRELKDPAKAEEVQKYCDRWWIVAADDSIVKDGELPPTWGLMVARGGKLINKTLAPKLAPQDPDKTFFASLLRTVAKEYVPQAMVQKQLTEAFNRGEAAGKTPSEYLAGKYKSLRAAVDGFQEKSGIRIDSYNGPQLGEAVAYVMRRGGNVVMNDIRGLTRRLKQVVNNLDAAAAEIEEAEKAYLTRQDVEQVAVPDDGKKG